MPLFGYLCQKVAILFFYPLFVLYKCKKLPDFLSSSAIFSDIFYNFLLTASIKVHDNWKQHIILNEQRYKEKIKRENEELQRKIDSYEDDSIKTIEQYRTEIDDRTLKTNETIHQIEGVIQEKDDLIKKMHDDNEAKKQQVYAEDAQICDEIEDCKTKLEIIRKFEEDKESIQQEINRKEQSIED